MLVRGATVNQLNSALKFAGGRYEDNLELIELRRSGTGYRFRLSVKNSRGPGHRLGIGRMIGHRRGPLRIRAACWHAYRDYFKSLFMICPDTVVITALARYDGIADFYQKFADTGDHTIGSVLVPIRYRDGCECEGPAPEFVVSYERSKPKPVETTPVMYETCPECGGKVIGLSESDKICMDCEYDSLEVR